MYQANDPNKKAEPVKFEQTTTSNNGKVVPLNRFSDIPEDHPYAGAAKARKELEDELILLRARMVKFFRIPQFLDWIIKLMTKKPRP